MRCSPGRYRRSAGPRHLRAPARSGGWAHPRIRWHPRRRGKCRSGRPPRQDRPRSAGWPGRRRVWCQTRSGHARRTPRRSQSSRSALLPSVGEAEPVRHLADIDVIARGALRAVGRALSYRRHGLGTRRGHRSDTPRGRTAPIRHVLDEAPAHRHNRCRLGAPNASTAAVEDVRSPPGRPNQRARVWSTESVAKARRRQRRGEATSASPNRWREPCSGKFRPRSRRPRHVPTRRSRRKHRDCGP